MTDTLPPGCAPLTFDPENRETWGNKIVVNDDEPHHNARIVDVEGTDRCLASWRHANGAPCAWFFDAHGWSDDTHYRLYDAAPEPVKPREWWAAEKSGPPMIFHTKEERSDWLRKRNRTLNDASTFRQFRLIEAPEGGR